ERLAKGRSIGSGAIEGACKYVIGRRLKSTGGRWPPENAVRMGRLRSTHYARDWQQYWQDRLSLAV
ncbi:MAG: ISKra4 family transposase, partial [Planctomycetia bacterium]